MRNGATGAVTSVGKIFFVDAPMGLPAATCRTLGRSQKPPTTGLASYTFQEYFAQPRNFLTSATWSDMVATDHLRGGGADHRPAGIAAECCDHGDWRHGDKVNGSSATCLPPHCASPAIHFSMGPHLTIDENVLRDNPTCLDGGAAPAKSLMRTMPVF